MIEVAETVVRNAIAGEPWAVAELGNRLDGRPAQALTVEDVTAPRLEGEARLHELARRLAYLLVAVGPQGPAGPANGGAAGDGEPVAVDAGDGEPRAALADTVRTQKDF